MEYKTIKVPRELHKGLKLEAAIRGQTIMGYVGQLHDDRREPEAYDKEMSLLRSVLLQIAEVAKTYGERE